MVEISDEFKTEMHKFCKENYGDGFTDRMYERVNNSLPSWWLAGYPTALITQKHGEDNGGMEEI